MKWVGIPIFVQPREEIFGDPVVQDPLAIDGIALLVVEGGCIVLEMLNESAGFRSFVKHLCLALVHAAPTAHMFDSLLRLRRSADGRFRWISSGLITDMCSGSPAGVRAQLESYTHCGAIYSNSAPGTMCRRTVITAIHAVHNSAVDLPGPRAMPSVNLWKYRNSGS